MVFNVRRFSTAAFPVEFLDANGVLTVPSSATMTITYASTAGVLGSTVVNMVPVGFTFVGNWAAGNADLGLWSYSISAPGQVSPITGSIRVLSSTHV